MKKKCFMLTAIAMLCWVASSQAAITTTMVNGDLIVQTDQEGIAGLKGCDAKTAKKRAAYLFELQQQAGAIKGTCRAGQGGRWTTIAEEESEDGQAVFEDLPDGHYRVICRVGKAIGCEIVGVEEGVPSRSIVYELEKELYYKLDAESRKKSESSNQENTVEGLLVYPNPASTVLNVVLDNSEMETEVNLVVYDLVGKKIAEKKQVLDGSGQYNWEIKTGAYPSGTYFLQLTDVKGKSLQSMFLIVQTK